MKAIKHEALVSEDGLVRVPGLRAGEKVEVIVLRAEEESAELPASRFGGWAKGKIKILPGFDDPIPGMEEYM